MRETVFWRLLTMTCFLYICVIVANAEGGIVLGKNYTQPLTVRCGEASKGARLTVQLSTQIYCIGEQLHWTIDINGYGSVWYKEYSFDVVCAGLHYLPHNGSGGGSNHARAAVWVAEYPKETTEEQMNLPYGIRIPTNEPEFLLDGLDDCAFYYIDYYDIDSVDVRWSVACGQHHDEP